MATTENQTGTWNDQVWRPIDDGVTKAVGIICAVQKVFSTRGYIYNLVQRKEARVSGLHN
jgi:hypothetical protein